MVPDRPLLTVVVPTYNESESIERCLAAVSMVLSESRIPAEILVIDDHSPDGTAEIARKLRDRYPVRVVERPGERGLASAVLKGFAEARADIVLVMDADLSHPPEKIPELYEAVRSGRSDLAIGSRYVTGGEIPGWPLHRRLQSRLGTLLARGLTKVQDPLAGFFCCRKEVVAPIAAAVPGYKILLEILVRGRYRNVLEIPITFHDRAAGESKLAAKQKVEYLRQLRELYGSVNPPAWQFAKFCLVGLSGVAVHMAVLLTLVELVGLHYMVAAVSAFACAVTSNYLLNRTLTFRAQEIPLVRSYVIYVLGSLVGLGAQLATLRLLVEELNVWYPPAMLAGIALGTLSNFILSRLAAFPKSAGRPRFRSVYYALRGVLIIPWCAALLLPVFPESKPGAGEVVASVLLIVLGLLIRQWGAQHLGTAYATRRERAESLVTSGPYAYTRNPLYIGNILIAVGLALLSGLPGYAAAFAIFLMVHYNLVVRCEESFLEEHFGGPYRRYKANVPRWIPRLTPYDVRKGAPFWPTLIAQWQRLIGVIALALGVWFRTLLAEAGRWLVPAALLLMLGQIVRLTVWHRRRSYFAGRLQTAVAGAVACGGLLILSDWISRGTVPGPASSSTEALGRLPEPPKEASPLSPTVEPTDPQKTIRTGAFTEPRRDVAPVPEEGHVEAPPLVRQQQGGPEDSRSTPLSDLEPRTVYLLADPPEHELSTSITLYELSVRLQTGSAGSTRNVDLKNEEMLEEPMAAGEMKLTLNLGELRMKVLLMQMRGDLEEGLEGEGDPPLSSIEVVMTRVGVYALWPTERNFLGPFELESWLAVGLEFHSDKFKLVDGSGHSSVSFVSPLMPSVELGFRAALPGNVELHCAVMAGVDPFGGTWWHRRFADDVRGAFADALVSVRLRVADGLVIELGPRWTYQRSSYRGESEELGNGEKRGTTAGFGVMFSAGFAW